MTIVPAGDRRRGILLSDGNMRVMATVTISKQMKIFSMMTANRRNGVVVAWRGVYSMWLGATFFKLYDNDVSDDLYSSLCRRRSIFTVTAALYVFCILFKRTSVQALCCRRQYIHQSDNGMQR